MKINYGPPGHKGVTSIMGIGDTDEVEKILALPPDRPLKIVTVASMATWALGAATGRKDLQTLGLGASFAAFAIQMLQKRQETKQTEATLEAVIPTDVQGWG